MTNADVLELHRDLVGIRSLSHQETEIADWVESYLRGLGIAVDRTLNNVVARAGSGPAVLFNTHLDTVPPDPSYTRDPWEVESIEGRVYGLGSNDAKASAAAMIATLVKVHEQGGPVELTLMLVQEEETGGKGTEVVWPSLVESGYQPVGVVVGEPTELNVGIAQKGLMIVHLESTGDACHAANRHRLQAVNPVWQLAKDLANLEHLRLEPVHPDLGPCTMEPTMLSGAKAHNQVPGVATCTLDLRTVPPQDHSEILRLIQSRCESNVRAGSLRLDPYECSKDAAIVRAALRASSGAQTLASPTMSDQVFFRGVDAIKCGPGASSRSHSADEYVLESEILGACEFYERLLAEVANAATLG